LDWIANNQTVLLIIIAGLFTVAGGIVKMTANQTDDKWYNFALGWWNKILTVLGKRPPTQ